MEKSQRQYEQLGLPGVQNNRCFEQHTIRRIELRIRGFDGKDRSLWWGQEGPDVVSAIAKVATRLLEEEEADARNAR